MGSSSISRVLGLTMTNNNVELEFPGFVKGLGLNDDPVALERHTYHKPFLSREDVALNHCNSVDKSWYGSWV